MEKLFSWEQEKIKRCVLRICLGIVLKKYEIELPKIITEAITDEQLDRMAEATLKNENPFFVLPSKQKKDWNAKQEKAPKNKY